MAARSPRATFRRPQRLAAKATALADVRRFASPGDGTKELFESYNAWTSGLAKHALQVAFALIGANWALYGTQAGILSNGWATASLFVAVAYLVLLLLLMQCMVLLHKRQYKYAETDRSRWAKEFDAAATEKSDWPYPKAVALCGTLMPWLHVCAPVLSGLLLAASAYLGPSISKSPVAVPSITNINVGTPVSASAVENLGTISGFSLGDSNLPTAVASNTDLIAKIALRWRRETSQGGKVVLVLVGSADRVPLSNDVRRRFEGNFGLASSRADAVKSAILAECLRQDSGCGLRAEQIVVLASGPVRTQASWSKLGRVTGYPDDRRVDVWAFWSAGG